MKFSSFRIPFLHLVGLCWLLALLPGASLADTYVQRIELRPGWNAIYVEVQPLNDSIEQVFAGVPIASAWRWIPDDRTVSFIRNPGEELLSIDGWFGYFPPNRPERFLTNLFTITANQAYLVRLQGSSNVTLEIEGRPVLRPQRWRTNGFQLTGFPVDPAAPPTFGSWFATSDAHAGQPMFRLDDKGQWVEITQPHIQRMRSGEAYWIYTRGPSSFQGPMSIELDFGQRLDFAGTSAEEQFVIRNRSGLSNQVRIRKLDADVPVPLVIEQLDPVTAEASWPALPMQINLSVPVDESLIVRLGVRRASLFAEDARQILEVSNGFGARRLIEVAARATQRGAPAQPLSLLSQGRSDGSTSQQRAADPRYAGLWLGVATVRRVSEAQTGGVVPVEASGDFPLRFLMHIDSFGNVRFLKEVIQMWENGTLVPDPENPGFFVTDTPGRYVLITDDRLIPQFEGALFRGGQPVGLRLSTAAFDFEGRELDLNGFFGPGGAVFGTIVLAPEFPTNPFLHRFHPDHNNLDAQFLNFSPDAYEVTREFEFLFAEEDPEDFDRPEWGDGELAGTFNEAISGLHRSTIFVSGEFRMRRVLTTPLLNQ